MMKLIITLIILIALFSCIKNAETKKKEQLYALAIDHYKNKNFKGSIRVYNELIKLDSSKKVKYIFARGLSRSYINNFDGAKKDLLFSIKNSYNKKEAYQMLAANALKQSNDTVSALNYINTAYSLYPNDEEILNFKLILMGREAAFQFTLDSLISK